ncbi:MAG: right-handed parallel beta-helix repeat-containing protein [Planctomycetota bacterium]|nr:right-handed parallel beta-helix repeat-containing protein [Planctomycetota bacterium]
MNATKPILPLLALAFLAAMPVRASEADPKEWVVAQGHPQAADENPGTAEKPLKTIGKALALVQPGQSVTIHAGVYREELIFNASGTAEDPIRIAAAPGERVVVSGADEIAGWKRCGKDELPLNPDAHEIFFVDLDWKPVDLYAGGDLLRLNQASWPKVKHSHEVARGLRAPKDHYPVEGGGVKTLLDSKNLNQPAGFWDGGEVVIHRYWISDGRSVSDQYLRGTVAAYAPDRRELTLDKPLPKNLTLDPAAKHDLGTPPPKDPEWRVSDWYRIVNLPTLIREPGSYAVVPRGAGIRMFVWPPEGVDFEKRKIEGSRRRMGLRGEKVSHVTVEGLEVARVVERGLAFDDGEHNAFIRCAAYFCRMGPFMTEAAGIYLSQQKHAAVRHCLSVLNGHGLMLYKTSNTAVEGNVAGRNIVDGIVVAWYSNDVTVARNYVFDNWAEKHPDGVQTYRTAKNLVLDRNFFFCVGQGWQCEETQDAQAARNVWAGIHHNAISCSKRPSTQGHEPNRRLRFANNTVFTGAIGTGYDGCALENVILSSVGILADGEVDRNLYGSRAGGGAAYEKGGSATWTKTFEEWQAAVKPNSQHDRLAEIRFRNGPRFEAKGECEEPGPLKLNGGSAGFEIGDHVELDCDGVVREVAEVTSTGIAVKPALEPERLGKGAMVVWNWKERTDFTLDLRLADDSPGKGMAQDGGDVGSPIDVQAYMRGDPDGDGKRDLPDLPPEVAGHRLNGTPTTRFLKW